MNLTCNFCKNTEVELIYTPVGSSIDLNIYICKQCGLVFGHGNEIEQKETKFTYLSCEANYSQIRVGKQQMVDYIFDMFKFKAWWPTKDWNVLDMRSARGDFALKAIDTWGVKVDCIEEDNYMVDNYKYNSNINLWSGKYYDVPFRKKYDLIYSCHTLEHYKNPAKVLDFIKQNLTDNGYFYLNVPNLEYIKNNLFVDEYFYDNHLFYFTKKHLIYYITSLGFVLNEDNSDEQNISLLFKKDLIKHNFKYDLGIKNYFNNRKLIVNYGKNLQINRKKLIKIGENLNNNLLNNKTVIIGCGRTLDAFIKYGNINLDNCILVDDYLSKITKTIYGRDLKNTHELIHINEENLNYLILIKKPKTKKIISFGVGKTVYLGDLLNV